MVQELRAYLDGNFEFTQEYLKEHLPKATFRISEATYLAWVDLSKYFEPDEVLTLFFAYKAGVLSRRRKYVCTAFRWIYPPEPCMPTRNS